MGDLSDTGGSRRQPEYFSGMERLAHDDVLELKWSRHRKWFASAGTFHLFILLLLIVGPLAPLLWEEPVTPGEMMIRFWESGGEGRGSGGGGGGSRGERITAFIPNRNEPEPEPELEVEQPPRQAPVAPRKPQQLTFDDNIPEISESLDELFDGVFSPDERENPGLSLTDLRDLGGIDTTASAGTGGGIGGGDGTGVGEGEGWGVGPGRGGGFGGGDYSPGAWDIDPIVVFEPPEPPYPESAREKMVNGEVILQVLVKVDGSTEVISVIKSLPYGCVDAAKEHAKLYRWKPALKEGKPVEAFGIITVKFDIFRQAAAKS